MLLPYLAGLFFIDMMESSAKADWTGDSHDDFVNVLPGHTGFLFSTAQNQTDPPHTPTPSSNMSQTLSSEELVAEIRKIGRPTRAGWQPLLT